MSDNGFDWGSLDVVRCARCGELTGQDPRKEQVCSTCGPLKIRESDRAKGRSLLRGDPITSPHKPEM